MATIETQSVEPIARVGLAESDTTEIGPSHTSQFTRVPHATRSSASNSRALPMLVALLFGLSSFLLASPIDALAACGDAVLDSGEDCDDGNTAGGDCCSSTCLFDQPGAECVDDGSVCTTDLCDGAGTCIHAAGNAGETCRPAAGRAAGAVSAVPAGALAFPFAISKHWFSGRAAPCGPGSTINMVPTGNLAGCGGWHTFTEVPASPTKLKTVPQGLRYGTFTSPAAQAGVARWNFTGGAVSTTFPDVKALYDSKKDANGEWTVLVGVYDDSGCSNPSGQWGIIGFATARIFKVFESSSKEILANVDCAIVDSGEGGGADFGTQVAFDRECDAPEVCDGVTPTCPQDSRQPSGTPCKDDGSVCTTELCDGAGTCVHAAGNAGLECRASTGVCDLAETCTGTSAACPTDISALPNVECRASAGDCDVAEHCTGNGPNCPADAFAPSSRECRASLGTCDPAETCTGNAAACPGDILAPPSQECRVSAGPCDVPDNCSGSDAACPADAFSPPTRVCRAAAADCDVAENCTGGDAACPTDVLATREQECRPSAGPCDAVENCTGSDATCPADAKQTNTTVCRFATGTCDQAEYCDGQADSCPADTGMPACGSSDLCCPANCAVSEDADCCSGSLAFTDCRVRPIGAGDRPDRYRISCAVLDASGSAEGLHPDTDPLWLWIRDASTSTDACIQNSLSAGACIDGTCNSGTFEFESCAKDSDCRPCRHTSTGFRCKSNRHALGINKVALKLLHDGSGSRYKLVINGSAAAIACSRDSLPWSLRIAQGTDCGDIACTRIDADRVSCPGVP